jgi:hypothetical protein
MMKINFFEEYPTEENMKKLDMIDWPAMVFIAASSIKDFESLRDYYVRKYPQITFGWWPTIPGSYWVSGLVNPSDLDKLFSEITMKRHESELAILIDFEFPLKKYLWFKNIFNVRKNKKKIKKIFQEAPEYNLKIYTAEYPASNNFFLGLWKFLGLSPAFSLPHTKLVMFYTSMGMKFLGKFIWSKVRRFEKYFSQSNHGRVGFGLGTIAAGILGNEPILSPENFAEDLKWAEESGVEEVFIFRLGGFDRSYVSILKKYTV